MDEGGSVGLMVLLRSPHVWKSSSLEWPHLHPCPAPSPLPAQLLTSLSLPCIAPCSHLLLFLAWLLTVTLRSPPPHPRWPSSWPSNLPGLLLAGVRFRFFFLWGWFLCVLHWPQTSCVAEGDFLILYLSLLSIGKTGVC